MKLKVSEGLGEAGRVGCRPSRPNLRLQGRGLEGGPEEGCGTSEKWGSSLILSIP